MCHSSPILSGCKKKQADIITENYSVAITDRGWRKMVRDSYKKGRRVGVGRGAEWGMCEMTALNDKHSCDSGPRVNHSGGDFLLRGDSVTSLYHGHILKVSPQRLKCTGEILRQYKSCEKVNAIRCLFTVRLSSWFIMKRQLNAQVFAVSASHSTTHRHKRKYLSCAVLHAASEIKLLAFHLLFLTLEDYPSLLLYMQQLMLSHCVIPSTFSHSCSPLPALSRSHPNFK